VPTASVGFLRHRPCFCLESLTGDGAVGKEVRAVTTSETGRARQRRNQVEDRTSPLGEISRVSTGTVDTHPQHAYGSRAHW
jgi:hypothetical protein